MNAAIWKDIEVAAAYLDERSLVIPERARQLEILLRVVRYAGFTPRRILDLGCGDAILLSAFLAAYPEASGVALDFSPRMIEQAMGRLAPVAHRARVGEADLATPEWREAITGSFDVIVSGLAIHHLTDSRKRALYQEVYDLLSPGGVFLNAEHVRSATPLLEEISNDIMAEHLLDRRVQRGEDARFEDVRREFLDRPDRQANILALVEDQCGWLHEIGFVHVDCYWKYFELAIFGGFRKPASNQ